MSEMITIHGVRGFVDNDGTAQVNLEDVSRGLGFIQTKGVVEYIRWERVKSYLREMGFPHLVGKEFIPENVFYRLAMKGETDSAIAFQAKVADDILPNIRKHGAYMTPETIERALTDPDFIIGLATKLKQANEEKVLLQSKINEDRPKVVFAEALEVSKDSILIADLSKLLRQNGVNVGEKRLFETLRQQGYLIKSGSERNMPTQRSMELQIMEIKVGQRGNSNDGIKVTRTPKITGKGVGYFINKFKKMEGALV